MSTTENLNPDVMVIRTQRRLNLRPRAVLVLKLDRHAQPSVLVTGFPAEPSPVNES